MLKYASHQLRNSQHVFTLARIEFQIQYVFPFSLITFYQNNPYLETLSPLARYTFKT